MRHPKAVPTELELEILKIVWKLKKTTVRDVYETLLDRRRIAYTTVMTMMNILEQKGHLRKERGEKAHVYSATRPERQVTGKMVREFVDRVFNGSARPLLVHLVEDRKLSEDDLRDLRRMIEEAK